MSTAESVRHKVGRNFNQLAGLARHILADDSYAFADTLVRLYEELNVPFLRFYASYTHEQMVEAMKPGIQEMLELFAINQAHTFVDKTVQQWRDDAYTVVDRNQIQAYDITLHNYAKVRALFMFMHRYTPDPQKQAELTDEMQRLAVILNSELFTVFMESRKQELAEVNQQLRNREQQLIEAQEVGLVGSFEWDFNRRQLVITPYVDRILERPAPTTLPEFLQFVHADDRDKLRVAVESAIEHGAFVCEFRYTGSAFPKVVLSRGKVEMTDGRVSRMLGTVMDVTERMRMIDQLRQSQAILKERERYLRELNTSLQHANRELLRTNEELESFNFIASHDLQEPLRKIQVYSDRILEQADELSPQTRQHFEKIMKASGRMQALIADFLSFSQTLKTQQAKEAIDLNEVVDEILRDMAVTIGEKGADIQVGQLPRLYGIRFHLKQLVANLLSNALKYVKPNTRPLVSVSYTLMKGGDVQHEMASLEMMYHCIAVADNGIGFHPKYKKRIFELFQRLHNKDTYSGTGIGLALCRKIAHNMGGFIDVESTPDHGSVFRIFLPSDAPASVAKVDPVERTKETG